MEENTTEKSNWWGSRVDCCFSKSNICKFALLGCDLKVKLVVIHYAFFHKYSLNRKRTKIPKHIQKPQAFSTDEFFSTVSGSTCTQHLWSSRTLHFKWWKTNKVQSSLSQTGFKGKCLCSGSITHLSLHVLALPAAHRICDNSFPRGFALLLGSVKRRNQISIQGCILWLMIKNQ